MFYKLCSKLLALLPNSLYVADLHMCYLGVILNNISDEFKTFSDNEWVIILLFKDIFIDSNLYITYVKLYPIYRLNF